MNGLSPYLREQIAGGKAVLFLGAGASIPAVGKSTGKGMSGSQLRDKLCDKFLGGESKSKPLNYVADRCFTAAGMGPVHRYLKELFGDLQPTPGHLAITKFRWKGIATTNYDLLIERAYDQTSEAQQLLERIIWNRDDFDAAIRNPNAVPLLKLHGCLNRINDPELPLVISSYDYYKFKDNRTMLVNTLREWATSYPIIFCGYGIADENIKEILFDVTDQGLNRPKFALVDPGLEAGDIDYWKSMRFDCLKMTFGDFIDGLKSSVTPAEIVLATAFREESTSVSKLIPSHEKPSAALSTYLANELQHIHSGLISSPVLASEFYKGSCSGFSWITSEFDIRRRVSDTLLEDAVIDSGRAALERPFLYLLKGYAGSGKSVSLKRFAWEASCDYDAPVFYLGQGTVLRPQELFELANLVRCRIFVVLDDILIHAKELNETIKECKRQRLRITFVGGVRTNEWNVEIGGLNKNIESEYELLDLNRKEVNALIEKLEVNRCLGFLEHFSSVERTDYFLTKLNSQLLVSLHEATEGKSFEEIIEDEYSKISPIEARSLYLDVCTLDRFGVGMRAGFVSRLSGVTFENFSSRLLKPLEHVISMVFDHRMNDYVYRSRHQHIAGLVFEQALTNPQDRAAQIVRILRYLNAAYESDRKAIASIVKGRALADQFTDKAYVSQIFEAALECGISISVVDHQRAVFELHHKSGDVRSALHLIQKVEKNPGTLAARTIAHTKSNILRRIAKEGRTPIERERFRQEALTILNSLTRNPRNSLPFLTRGQLLLEQLEERLSHPEDEQDSEVEARTVSDMTKEIESNLRQGLQLFPEDDSLLTFEARLSQFLNNTPRAIRALERAYASNKQGVYTAIRLARQYSGVPENREKALTMLRKLTVEQPLNKDAHYELARLLITLGESVNASEISQHLKRSFSIGDSHIEARFAYARHEFLYGNIENSRREFSSLNQSGINPEASNQVRREIRDSAGSFIWYAATVVSVHESFAFVRTSDFQDNVFLHYSAAPSNDVWSSIHAGTKLRITIGFAYKGPRVKRLSLID